MELLTQFIDLVLHLDTHLAALIAQYGTWIYLILFLIIFCETGLVITPFLPGDSLLFVAGTMAAVGSMDVHGLFALLSLAAFCGDNTNYWIGHYVGPRIFRRERSRLLNPAHLQRTQRFYEKHGGKTVVLARFMPKYIPGNPTIISQNMPGAGSLRAAQYVAQVAPKDGSVIGTMSRSLPVEPLIGDGKFDGRAFTWIGNIANNNSLCATWHTAEVKTWNDITSKPFVLGGEGPGSDLDNFALVLKNMFGAKLKLVSGYPGGSEVNLAMERRELDGRCGWSWSALRSRDKHLLDQKL